MSARFFFATIVTRTPIPPLGTRVFRLSISPKDLHHRFLVKEFHLHAKGRHAHGEAVIFGGDGTRLWVAEASSTWRKKVTKKRRRIFVSEYPGTTWESFEMARLRVTNLGRHRLTFHAAAVGVLVDEGAFE